MRVPSYFYLSSAGTPPPIAGDGGNLQSFWSNPTLWVDGLTQETCRDNGHHEQFALGSALHAAETAWHQGVDIYTPNERRFTDALELMAYEFLTGSMRGTCANNTPTNDRYESWEVGYTHYHFRVGRPLLSTGQLIVDQIRPRASRAVWNLVHETLTHANLPASVSPLGGAIPPTLSDWKVLSDGAFQFAFANRSSLSYMVVSSADLSLPLARWEEVGSPENIGSGLFRFTTPSSGDVAQRYYRLRSQ